WLKFGPQRDPFPQKWYPDYQNNLWEAIHQNGGGCDYVSEHVIRSATFEDGRMLYGDRAYDTLLLPGVETMDPKTARSLTAFVDSGGKVVFIGKKPFKSAAYLDAEVSDSAVKGMVDALLERSDGNVLLHPSPKGDPIQWYGKLQDDLGLKPYVRFEQTHKYLSQSSYSLGGNCMYFIANTSLSEDIPVHAKFQVDNTLRPWIWNPETGERFRFPTTYGNGQIDLVLPRATSLLIVFESNIEGELCHPVELVSGGKEISGLWNLKLHHMNGERQELKLDSLADLVDISATKDFAGTVFYDITMNVDNGDYRYIDLGDVQGITELILNGTELGTKWYGAHVYDIGSAVKEGENHLGIKLTTISGNYVKSLKDNPVAQRWTRNQANYPMGILGPVRIY
ncbi:MAG: hypothetical protein U9R49_14945, partial [Bacteroidota bacterium]|nr:hypothetical protein [Bacteroidota bacterium]